MDKFSYLQITNLYHHHYEECIRSNIKWCSKEYISTPLIQLTAEFSICYIKLKQYMTRRRSIWIFDKFDYFSDIPSIDNNSSAMRVVFNLTYYITNLISYKIINTICSLISYFYIMIDKIFDIGVSANKKAPKCRLTPQQSCEVFNLGITSFSK